MFLPYGPNTPGEFKRRLALEREKPFLSLPTVIQNKTKLVAWVVANCGGGRARYAEELKKHIPVDIYGKCSSMKCDNRSSHLDNINPPTGCCKLYNRISKDRYLKQIL